MAAGSETARPTVIALVLAAQPNGAEDAKGLASRLCLFLADPCGWTHTASPDLAVLLSEASIAGHLDRLAAAGKSGKTRENHRADLRRLSRAAAGNAPVVRARVPGTPRLRPVEGEPDLLAVLGCPRPLIATARALGLLRGRAVRREDFNAAIRASLTSAAPAGGGASPGTEGGDHTAAALVAATDAALKAVSQIVTRTGTSAQAGGGARTAPASGRPTSRAAALRHARAAMAAAAVSGPVLTDPVDPGSLPLPVAQAITAYRPQGLDATPRRRVIRARPGATVSR